MSLIMAMQPVSYPSFTQGYHSLPESWHGQQLKNQVFRSPMTEEDPAKSLPNTREIRQFSSTGQKPMPLLTGLDH
jgi:hypothetical protein